MEKSKSRRHTRMQWAVAVLVNTTVFTYGLQCSWVSPMKTILQSTESPVGRPFTDSEFSLIAGIPSLSAVVGIPILLYVVETYGRKKAVILMAVFQFICWIIKLCPSSLNSLLAARIFAGLGGSGVFHIVPMYIKEISQDNIRGTLGSIFVLFQNFGILTMYGIGGYLGYYTVLYIVTAISAFSVVMLLKAPESPSFLVNQGMSKDALATVAYLRGLNVDDKEVLDEIDLITREHNYFKSIPNISFFTTFKYKAWRNGFIIMLMMITVVGLNGAFAIINYASTVLQSSNIPISPELQSLAIPIFSTVGTAITMTIVDKIGRKLLLGICYLISTLAFATIASSQLLTTYGFATPSWLPIVSILMTVFSYGAGISPLPFIIMAEMFNFQIRAKFIGFLSGFAWLMTFFQLLAFTEVTNTFGVAMSFYMFSIINLIGAIIVWVWLPETAGKTVEEIESKLGIKKSETYSGA